MAKTITSLLKISLAIRNLGTLTNYTMTKRFVRSAGNYNKETLVSARPYLVIANDAEVSDSMSLEETLNRSKLSSQVFSIVQANHSKMSGSDAISALNKLIDIEKWKTIKTRNIYEEKEFLILCEVLKKNMRKLEPGDCITALKAMTFFNVPATSIIVQMILQMLSCTVNHLSLQQIAFLDFLLEKVENTPLVEALRIALPIVYENNVMTKLDRDSMESIKNALMYLSKKTTNSELFNVLIYAMEKCQQPMTPALAISVLWSFCELKCYPNRLPDFLNHVQNILAENVTSIERRTIMTSLKMIAYKMKVEERYFYHEGFVDACALAVISDDWGFKEAIDLLQLLIFIGHTQLSLLDYIAGKCFADPGLLQSCAPECIAILVNGFSAADYKPVFWDDVQGLIMNDNIFNAEMTKYSLAKLAVSFLSLDCYCPKLLERIFARSVRNLSSNAERARRILLYQAVKTLYTQYTGPLPVRNTGDFFIQPYKLSNFPLIKALECALGGSRYVVTNVRSNLGHIIEHVIVMRKGGFPMAINHELTTATDFPMSINDESSIETDFPVVDNDKPGMEFEKYPIVQLDDIKPPPDSQVILLMCLPTIAYSMNTQRMDGSWSLKIRTLEALSGYTVIPIRSAMWFSLSENEQIPYLMQAIRLKCDEVGVSAPP